MALIVHAGGFTMKMLAVASFAALSIGLLGCPEEQVKPDPSKSAAKPATATSAAPAAAPAPSTKAKEEGSGW